MTPRSKGCLHVGNLSERRILETSISVHDAGYLCLKCFQVFNSQKLFVLHARPANHPLSWNFAESVLFCAFCASVVHADSLGKKNRILVERIITALRDSFGKSRVATNNLTSDEPEPVQSESQLKPILSSSQKPRGLYNLGNTCFMNAILQCLASLDSLQHLQEQEPDGPLSCSLHHLLVSLKRSAAVADDLPKKFKKNRALPRTNSIDPANFFEQLSRRYDFFGRNEQQDSHEFLRLLFNALDDECAEYGNSESKLLSWHRKYFTGTVLVRIECLKCKNVKYKNEECLDLSLALNNATFSSLEESFSSMTLKDTDTSCSITTLVKGWNQVQILKGADAFACENCFRKCLDPDDRSKIDAVQKVIYTNASCKHIMNELPTCLLIHLRRFSASPSLSKRQRRKPGSTQLEYAKDHRDVILPKTLDSNHFRENDETSIVYELKAMVVHEGNTADSGHYICIVKRESCWYWISDLTVNAISEEKALACRDAYLVFYEQPMGLDG